MPAAAAIVPAVAAVAGGAMQAKGARGAANAQTAAAQQSNAVQLGMFNTNAALNDPFRMGGGSAFNEYLQMIGLAPQEFRPAADIIAENQGGIGAAPSSGGGKGFDIFNPLGTHSKGGIGGALTLDPLGLFKKKKKPKLPPAAPVAPVAAPRVRDPNLPTTGYSADEVERRLQATPGYQFRQREGQRAIESSAAARGGLNSGATLRALTEFGHDYGTSEYTNYLNRLSTLFGGAQQATANIGNAGQNYANSASNNAINAGNARAGMYSNQADAIGGTIGALGSIWGRSGWGSGSSGASSGSAYSRVPGGGTGGGP